MRKLRLVALAAGLATLTGCVDMMGPDAFEDIAGTYSGTMTGVSNGVAMQSRFTLTISQNAGVLSGSYGLAGNLDDGIDQAVIVGSGGLDGTVGSGRNPSVTISTRIPGCPQHRENFSGTYDSQNHVITMIGPLDVLDDDCTVLLRYSVSFVLTQ